MSIINDINILVENQYWCTTKIHFSEKQTSESVKKGKPKLSSRVNERLMFLSFASHFCFLRSTFVTKTLPSLVAIHLKASPSLNSMNLNILEGTVVLRRYPRTVIAVSSMQTTFSILSLDILSKYALSFYTCFGTIAQCSDCFMTISDCC